jgi:hypothetical protein
MLESAGISILMKAIDFLFDEGRKILEERRERRKLEDNSDQSASSDLDKKPDSQGTIIQNKEDVLNLPLNQVSLISNQKELSHIMSLIDIYRKNYYLASEQYAKWGEALVPSIILHNLEEAENGLKNSMTNLEKLLGHIYGKSIHLPENDQDSKN